MLLTLDIPSLRPTRDIDLLGYTSNAPDRIVQIFREICCLEVELDGIRFEPESVRAHVIKQDAEYEGVRVQLQAHLGTARIPLQIDIGFADVLTPAPVEVQYPTLLPFPAPELQGYPLETIVAEKLQAMVFFGSINSRMKDFYDLWILLTHFDFKEQTLRQAILHTFRHRKTPIPDSIPVALSDAFAQEKQSQWLAFVKRSRLEQSVPDFLAVVQELRTFLMPHLRAVAKREMR